MTATTEADIPTPSILKTLLGIAVAIGGGMSSSVMPLALAMIVSAAAVPFGTIVLTSATGIGSVRNIIRGFAEEFNSSVSMRRVMIATPVVSALLPLINRLG